MNKRPFQVGDLVRDNHDGLTTVITRIQGDTIWGYWIERDGTKRTHEQNASIDDNIELIKAVRGSKKAKKEKPEAPYKFLLQYELENDPLELYKTMAEVKARVIKLAENDRYFKRDSVKVYELKGLPKVVKISTTIRVGK